MRRRFVDAAALPMWRNGQPPPNIDAVEDDDVAFECNVIGRPKPTVSLTFNARPLDQGLRRCTPCIVLR